MCNFLHMVRQEDVIYVLSAFIVQDDTRYRLSSTGRTQHRRDRRVVALDLRPRRERSTMWVSMFWSSSSTSVDESSWTLSVMSSAPTEYDGSSTSSYESFGFGSTQWLSFSEISSFAASLGEEWPRFVVFCGWSIWSGSLDVEINWFWSKAIRESLSCSPIGQQWSEFTGCCCSSSSLPGSCLNVLKSSFMSCRWTLILFSFSSFNKTKRTYFIFLSVYYHNHSKFLLLHWMHRRWFVSTCRKIVFIVIYVFQMSWLSCFFFKRFEIDYMWFVLILRQKWYWKRIQIFCAAMRKRRRSYTCLAGFARWVYVCLYIHGPWTEHPWLTGSLIYPQVLGSLETSSLGGTFPVIPLSRYIPW